MAENAKISEINKDDLIFPPEDPAQYESWYREQVEIGLKEADDPNTEMIPHEDVMRELEEMRARWRARERDAA